jgi:undecaprenyl pyrophosphate synthase
MLDIRSFLVWQETLHMTKFSSLGWLQDRISTKAEEILLHVLSSGPIPNHVAFVMDGNRRYARMNHKQTIQGHTDGFMALRRVRVSLDSIVGFPKLPFIT